MSGVSTPALSAAVSRAGGLGSFGFAYATPDDIWDEIAAARSMHATYLNANFFMFSHVDEALVRHRQSQVVKHLQQFPHTPDEDFRSSFGPPYVPNLKEQLEPIWESRPEVLTFHFGIPPASVLNMAKKCHILVGVTATSIQEACAIQSCGADFIIAQGVEAGGHMGCFDPPAPTASGFSTVSDLVQAIRCHDVTRKMPLVAAGGIMNGADIDSALHPEGRLGADVVQMGTAFLATDESGASGSYKQHLTAKSTRGTVLTTAFSGRSAQAISNAFTQGWGEQQPLPFPVQNTLTQSMRQRAKACHDAEYQSLYAGVNYRLCRHCPTSFLMDLLIDEYNQCRMHAREAS
mmetsp:Transcript_5931/g.9652  ORF Transcript_5931/g.9652 Transcript_5931/m.9652 type:complete len:348 (+) Transcript_5931:980-2023(+)